MNVFKDNLRCKPFRPFAVALGAMAIWACGTAPDERYAEALSAAAAFRDAPKDEKAKALDDLLHFFDTSSADVVRGGWYAGKMKGDYRWVDPTKLLFDGQVSEVKEDGNIRLVMVKNAKGKTREVRMVEEGGLWVVDGFSLKRFWQRLRQSEM